MAMSGASVVQVHSSAKSLRLVTFDADGTLYADGCHMEHDNEMVGASSGRHAVKSAICRARAAWSMSARGYGISGCLLRRTAHTLCRALEIGVDCQA